MIANPETNCVNHKNQNSYISSQYISKYIIITKKLQMMLVILKLKKKTIRVFVKN